MSNNAALNIWLFFWPILAISSWAAYYYAAKKQNKSLPVSFNVLLAGSLIVWAALLAWSLA